MKVFEPSSSILNRFTVSPEHDLMGTVQIYGFDIILPLSIWISISNIPFENSKSQPPTLMIDPQTNKNEIDAEMIQTVLTNFVSLFSGTSHIELQPKEISFLRTIFYSIDSPRLLSELSTQHTSDSIKFTLHPFRFLPPNDSPPFTFICGSKQFECCSVFASLISPKAFELIQESLSELTIDLSSFSTDEAELFEESFENIFLLTKGGYVSIDDHNFECILEISKQLKFEELQSFCEENDFLLNNSTAPLTPSEIIHKLSKSSNSFKISNEYIEILSINFLSIPQKDLFDISPTILSKIFEHPSLELPNETFRFDFLLNYFHRWGCQSSFLFKFIDFQSLTLPQLSLFFSTIPFHTFTIDVQKSISSIFSLKGEKNFRLKEIVDHYYQFNHIKQTSRTSSADNLQTKIDAESHFQIGCTLESHYFIEHPIYECALHFIAADGMNHPEAGFRLWRLCQKHFISDIVNEAPLFYLRHSASLGFEPSISILNTMESEACSANYKRAKAFSAIQQLSDEGDPECQFNLAVLHRMSLLDKSSVCKAMHLYSQSGDYGKARSQNQFGFCICDDEKLPSDESEALLLLIQSCKDRHPDGLSYYGSCVQNGRGIGRNDDLAAHLYEKSAKSGNAQGIANYGFCLNNGRGVRKNPTAANEFFKHAIEIGNYDAMYYYALNLQKGKGVSQNLEEAAELLQRAAHLGHPSAMNDYGVCLKKGKGVQKNLSEANKYFKRASVNNDAKGMYNYALNLQKGIGVSQNVEEAAQLFKRSADLGQPLAINEYGICLNEGKGIKKNSSEANKYFKVSIEKGNLNAMYYYALNLQKGRGVSQNLVEAARLLKQAADFGQADAMNQYGLYLNEGKGISKNQETANEYFLLAINKGNHNAMRNYAVNLQNGHGVAQNLEEAAQLFKRSADLGHPSSMNHYGACLKNGLGVPKNPTEANKYFKLAIEKGNFHAMRNYAMSLQNGIGVSENLEESARLFKRSADLGHVDSMNNYGVCLNYGKGVPKDSNEANKYFKQAIEKGDLNAMVNYGVNLQNGAGVTQNLEEAAGLFKRGAELGHVDSIYYYGMCLNEGKGVPKNPIEANIYFKAAIDKGHTNAMHQYGSNLEHGNGITKNIEDAFQYYSMAADKGNFSSRTSLKRLSK